MENQVFTYQYSAVQNQEVEHIRQKYLPRVESKLERLKRLDFKVQTAGQIQSLCLGIIGILVFGLGMCFGLDVFVGGGWQEIVLCVLGVLIMIPAYPIYRRIATKTKATLTPEILRLSDEIIQNKD